ncbi:MAG: dihydroorotase [Bacteroidetes bacterium]|nr:dihydroorotase [Bacteroidota bacterium]
MRVLIKQANIISSSSPYHGQVKDILITEGIIDKIADHISENADEIIAVDNLHVSIGWMDIFANFCDPGYEHKETLETGCAAAAAGGFTDVMVTPGTQPPIATKNMVEYIVRKSAPLAVTVYPMGAISKNAEGKELAEMYDMHNSGAIAFGDGTSPLQSPGILLKALQYVLAIEATIVQMPDDKSISAHGLMNEGLESTRLGLPGKPAIAEELMIARDIELLRYTKSKLHITGVSTKKGIDLITAAKREGLNISCSATPYHGWFCDEDLQHYDTNLKVNPPLRSKQDMLTVQQAIADGVIDCIASHHLPQHSDNKACEFEYAKNGMTGLQTLFGAVNYFAKDLPRLIEQLTTAPRKIFGIAAPEIKEGETACLTLFDPVAETVFEKKDILSKSYNTAFTGKKLKGKVIGIVNKNKWVPHNK